MLRAGRFRYPSAKQKRKRHARRGNAAVAAGGGVGHSVDRLSALPDDLLHAVLRHLQAQQVVRTCVLSTRWRHLWRSVPCINIDQREFQAHPCYNALDKKQSFINFAHILLRRHDVASLDEFRLHVRSDMCGDAYSWVRSGLSQDDTWPCRLKRLHLSNVILDDHFGRHISSRCPALEDMELKNCSYLLTWTIVITSSSLKKLVVDGFRYTESDWGGFSFKVPALASLCLAGGHDYIVMDGMPHYLPSLVDASICLPVTEDDEESDHENVLENRNTHSTIDQLYLLGMLFNVRSLHLSHFAVMFLVMQTDRLKLPEFKNLKTLSLVECDISDDFLTLEHFLRNSPNLQKLNLRYCKVSNPTHSKEAIEKAHSYSQGLVGVKCDNLKLTEIIYRDDDVHLVVMFLLGMSRNLPNNKFEITKVN